MRRIAAHHRPQRRQPIDIRPRPVHPAASQPCFDHPLVVSASRAVSSSRGKDHWRWKSQGGRQATRPGTQSCHQALREDRLSDRPHRREQENGRPVQGRPRNQEQALERLTQGVALVFSPLSEEVLLTPPPTLFPRQAFVMRQLGDPPAVDERMAQIVTDVFSARGIRTQDADASTGGKDFLERILGLIRGTGFTVAIFSQDTRPTAMANIALELGFASMCGKPLVIIKSKNAVAPSDLTRTDWIAYDEADETQFRRKLDQALDQLDEIAAFQETLLEIALGAPSMDCAVAFERANKAFLLTKEARFLDSAEKIAARVASSTAGDNLADLERLRGEIKVLVRQGRRSMRGRTR